ncbi:MAG: response regulator [Cyanobacteriota bacterium]|nr:response regulator [Cyanobacteriota bacterium]
MKQATPKILVIEDEDAVRDNIEEILELSDYQVMTAANGELGLEALQSYKPDLIICDVMMPELDGYGVVKSLRENPETSNIPVIFLTAKVERSDQRLGMNLGADDYLTKPFLPKELLGAVDARLQRQKIYQSQVQEEQQKTESVRKEADKIQLDLDKRQQMLDVKDQLLNNLIQELTSPISSINLALKMVSNAQTEEKRQHYIKILEEECQREIQLLNEISKLQQFLLPENIELLQRFKLLK